jgi:hypothetical protein
MLFDRLHQDGTEQVIWFHGFTAVAVQAMLGAPRGAGMLGSIAQIFRF